MDFQLVRIPGGTFRMGSPDDEAGHFSDEGPVHEVSVAPFWLGRTPVTNAEFGRFLEANPGEVPPGEWANERLNRLDQPVVGVSWEDARRFAAWAGGRLPSEAEWEYACRAGTTTPYYTGTGAAALDRAGWYDGNSGGRTHDVGGKEPNAFGLHDMHGNVWEWCEDDLHGSYEGAPADRSAWVDGPGRGPWRVRRGGSWASDARFCRAAFRFHRGPGFRLANLGFRLAR